MRTHRPSLDPELLETLRFAVNSGAWLVAGAPASSRPAASDLAAVRRELGECRRCRLWQTRTRIVFGVGDERARVVFVGEAPGFQEDLRGEPFVGRAGQLLDRMLAALGLDRGRVYIANVLKCRPPDNRDPLADEVETCVAFLWAQIEAIRPRVICALGAHAARALLGVTGSISELRGKAQPVGPWTVVPTYHPAFLLRRPRFKRQAWADLKAVARLLAE
ncbi:uracil-DNA glycosylase [Deferrisoma camini]|uniref:uracil-DNA glycosylase n=1 Tax=Deferrisoma camini TaxID=1035120 RepID=UPI00046CDFC8|nr:uracil-DNA glycosylase [Deferrisoma camini]